MQTIQTKIISIDGATRYVHPKIVRSIVIGNITGRINIQNGAGVGKILQSADDGSCSWESPTSIGMWSVSGGNYYRTTGNIGIGTSTPASLLDVNGNIKTESIQILPEGSPDLLPGMILSSYDTDGNVQWVLQSTLDDGDWTKSEEIIYRASGSVGILTPNPTEALEVIGTIKTTNLKVTNGAQSGFILKSDGTDGTTSWANPTSLGLWSVNGSYYYYSGGNVGIGQSTPTQKLDVNGTIKTTGLQLTTGAGLDKILKSDANGLSSWVDPETVTHWEEVDGSKIKTDKIVSVHNTENSTIYGSFMIGNEFVFSGNGTSANKTIANNYKWDDGSKRINDGFASSISMEDATGKIFLNAANDGLANSDITWKSMVFTPEGKLGVGIATPAYTLDVQNNGPVDAHIHSTTTANSTIWASNYAGSYGFGVGIDGKGHLYRNIGMDNLMTFTEGGKVLIGDEPTELPGDYKLYVKGKIITTEVKIAEVPWPYPDYVFRDNYNLMPLAELETFIASNHHLPGVPCEDEVKENGMNLGENDALLLKKIEELTLYILQQDKKITDLQQKIETLHSNK